MAGTYAPRQINAAERRELQKDKKQVRKLEKELKRKDRALAEAIAPKKSPGHLGGRRRRLIVTADRQVAIEFIEEAVSAGARRHKACGVLEITLRTLQRWQKSIAEDQLLGDQRKMAAAERLPANKLTEIEWCCILAISNSQDYRSLPPSQIVPRLADDGEYMASESTFYRVLREADQVNRRGRAKPPRTLNKPQGYKATGPNQVWSWDITFLASTIRGAFYRLYMLMDIYSPPVSA